jgi:hypothetical protein
MLQPLLLMIDLMIDDGRSPIRDLLARSGPAIAADSEATTQRLFRRLTSADAWESAEYPAPVRARNAKSGQAAPGYVCR